jgi:hypothetical protein
MTPPRNEVCFSTPDGPPDFETVAELLADLGEALTKQGYEASVQEEPLALQIKRPRAMWLVVWGTPTHCALQLWDEPLEAESLDDSPESHATMQILFSLITLRGFEQEWIGLEDDIGSAPVG